MGALTVEGAQRQFASPVLVKALACLKVLGGFLAVLLRVIAACAAAVLVSWLLWCSFSIASD